MELPTSEATYAQERFGITAVQSYAARSRQIWRETTTGDVSIDGNLEYVNTGGFATGRIVGVQVKLGPSHFVHASTKGWKFYSKLMHRNYRDSFSLPVLLVLHDPKNERSYWTDAQHALQTPVEGRALIKLPAQIA